MNALISPTSCEHTQNCENVDETSWKKFPGLFQVEQQSWQEKTITLF